MLSINTNLSSLIAQQSMSSATNKLNQAIERMTTGYKINGAKDNAANYSISNNMQTQLSSYDVAADNVAMGMDLVTTASDIINNMQDKATRLQALCTQARNGTYGAQSMAAINSEAGAIMAEINRLYSTAEYNSVSLFNREAFQLTPEHQALTETLNSEVKAKAEYNGFIADPKTYTDEQVAAMTKVADVSTFSSGQKYSISSVEELQKLADYVNAGNDTTGVEFVLGDDIDLSSITNWTPIGIWNADSSTHFKGTFNGNGHEILNLTVSGAAYSALFGCAEGATLKNIAIKDADITSEGWGGATLLGHGQSAITIDNCYSTGKLKNTNAGGNGGLVGYLGGSQISNCYTNVDAELCAGSGGLVGILAGSSIDSCYSTGDVTATGGSIGGLVGSNNGGIITNSYATGDVSADDTVGGLVGVNNNGSIITNSYATGDVSGAIHIGGLVGGSSSTITNSYATGNVTGNTFVGGLLGVVSQTSGSVTYDGNASYGRVSGTDLTSTGSLIGGVINTTDGTSFGTVNITNSQSVAQDGINSIGECFKNDGTAISYDMTTMLAGISAVEFKNIMTTLQVGIKSDSSCQITFDTNFKFDLSAIEGNIASDEALSAIMEFTNLLSEKSTQLGAVQNRLDSALESITVNMENLTSSLSTIRDADIAEVSGLYIQQQILQQASATLLATANQSPSIALQLI